jgi:hypothetical protein
MIFRDTFALDRRLACAIRTCLFMLPITINKSQFNNPSSTLLTTMTMLQLRTLNSASQISFLILIRSVTKNTYNISKLYILYIFAYEYCTISTLKFTCSPLKFITILIYKHTKSSVCDYCDSIVMYLRNCSSSYGATLCLHHHRLQLGVVSTAIVQKPSNK